MNGPPIRGVIFDKDGTLFDFGTTWEAWAAAFIFRAAGGDRMRASDMGAKIGFDVDRRRFARDSIVIAGTPEDIASALSPFFPDSSRVDIVNMLNQEAAEAPQAEAVPLFPFLTGLRGRDLRLGVATNDGEAPARAHLKSAGIEHCFDFIAGSDSGYGGKPAPGQLLGFCAETGLTPESVVMVGDSLHDLRAGRAAGMLTFGVLTGMASEPELAPFADVVCPDIGHLPAWLDRVM